MGKKLIFFVFILFISNISFSSDERKELLNAKTLKCNWDGGVGISLDQNGEWEVGEDTLPETIIDSIDIKSNTARMIGNAGSADIRVFEFEYGLVFTESSYNYFHTMVIPYSYFPQTKDYYPIFYSRNVSIMGLAHSNTNLYGGCKIWGN